MVDYFSRAKADSIWIAPQIWHTVREWKVHFEQYNVPADQIERIAPAFRHIDDISTPELRKLIP